MAGRRKKKIVRAEGPDAERLDEGLDAALDCAKEVDEISRHLSCAECSENMVDLEANFEEALEGAEALVVSLKAALAAMRDAEA